MKTRTVILLILGIIIFSFTIASSKQDRQAAARKAVKEARAGKGLAMEDGHQFN